MLPTNGIIETSEVSSSGDGNRERRIEGEGALRAYEVRRLRLVAYRRCREPRDHTPARASVGALEHADCTARLDPLGRVRGPYRCWCERCDVTEKRSATTIAGHHFTVVPPDLALAVVCM